jgi:hypothetical protein
MLGPDVMNLFELLLPLLLPLAPLMQLKRLPNVLLLMHVLLLLLLMLLTRFRLRAQFVLFRCQILMRTLAYSKNWKNASAVCSSIDFPCQLVEFILLI